MRVLYRGIMGDVPWTGFWLAVGLGLRAFHYLRNPSLWHDEAAVVINVLQKGYAGLFGPLIYSEAAPPLFLWIEKAVISVFGDHLYAFRLLPFLASCAALAAIVACARHIMPAATVWVAMMAACSDTILWHSCEAKPYAVDLLIAAMLTCVIVLKSDWPPTRILLIMILITPAVIFTSFPACFLLGGVVLCLFPDVVRERQATTWFIYCLFIVVLFTAFALLLAGPIHAQRDERMMSCWLHTFPDWQRVTSIPRWLAMRTSEVLRYAYEPVGNALILIAAIGAWVLWKGSQRRAVIFLLAPVVLAALAGLAHQYPYGPYRVMTYAAPACWLLVGAGLPSTFAILRNVRIIGPIALALLLLVPVGQAGWRVVVPWRRADAAAAAAYVHARLQPSEVVIGNSWEDRYYFRDDAGLYLSTGELTSLTCNGAWVIATSADPDERQAILAYCQHYGPWRVEHVKEFVRVTVYHLARPTDLAVAGPHAGP